MASDGNEPAFVSVLSLHYRSIIRIAVARAILPRYNRGREPTLELEIEI